VSINWRAHRERWGRRAFLAASLGLGLVLGSGVAWAYWTISGAATAPQLESGSFDLTVGPTTGTEYLVSGGGSFQWSDFTVSDLFPGESQAFSLMVGNNSVGAHAGMSVAVAVAGQQSGFVSADNLTEYLTLQVFAPATAAPSSAALGGRHGSCSGTALTAPIGFTTISTDPANPTALGEFAVGSPASGSTATELCAVVAVTSGMPQPATAPTASFTLVLSATQTHQN